MCKSKGSLKLLSSSSHGQCQGGDYWGGSLHHCFLPYSLLPKGLHTAIRESTKYSFKSSGGWMDKILGENLQTS